MINLKSEDEIAKIRHSCSIVVEALKLAKSMVAPGTTSLAISKAVEKLIHSHDARPAFKGYNGFPESACISINDEVVHGIPAETPLRDGSLVKIDIGVEANGYFGDAARTFVVGQVDSEATRLMDVTRESLMRGIEQARVGNRLSDISHAIQKHVEAAGFGVVRQLVGHGLGQSLHEEPNVPNFGKPGRGPRLRSGMVLAIEPMVNAGTYDVTTDADGWTVRSADGTLSAHFEHTIAITPDGPEILTLGI